MLTTTVTFAIFTAFVAAQESSDDDLSNACVTTTLLYRSTYNSYVALGDSYAAGLGSLSRLQACAPGDSSASPNCTTIGEQSGPGACDKDEGSYAWQFAQRHVQPGGFMFPACSGADSATVQNSQVPYLQKSTDLVTVQMGGDDDTVFATVLKQCLGPQLFFDCPKAIANAQGAISSIVRNVDKALLNISATVSHTTTKALIGYVQFFGTESSCAIDLSFPYWPFSSRPSLANRILVNNLVAQANQQLITLAASRGFLFVDADPAYSNHRWCDTQEAWWIISKYKIQGTDAAGNSYTEIALGHPSYDGQQAYLSALNKTLFGS